MLSQCAADCRQQCEMIGPVKEIRNTPADVTVRLTATSATTVPAAISAILSIGCRTCSPPALNRLAPTTVPIQRPT